MTEDYPESKNGLGFRVDSTGKIYLGKTDKHTGETIDESLSDRLRKLDTQLHRRFMDVWNRHPELFTDLHVNGPLYIYRNDHSLTVFSLVPERYSSLEGYTLLVRGEENRVAEKAELQVPQSWSAFRIPDGEPSPMLKLDTTPAASEPELTSGQLRKNIMRKAKNIPSIQWIIEHLKEFGDVTITNHGKGSHASIVLQHRDGRGEFRQTIWDSICGTESINFGILWEFLDSLHISLQEFYDRLD